MKVSERSLGAIAEQLHVSLHGDAHCMIDGLADLQDAGKGDLSFCGNAHRTYLQGTRASAVITTADLAAVSPCAALVTDNPRLAWARVTGLLAPSFEVQPEIHRAAVVDSTADLAAGVHIAAGAVVGAHARLAEGVTVGAHCAIGAGVVIGSHTRLAAGVVCYPQVVIGEQCLIHSGVVIGADGFGFACDSQGVHQKIHQFGGVAIGDRVEIGANSTIDCGALKPTRIGNGVKIDNLVQIGHGCEIGDNCLFCAGCLVGGSVRMGTNCLLAGGSRINNGIRLAAGTVVGGSSTLLSSTCQGGEYLGVLPAQKKRDWLQFIRFLKRREHRVLSR